MRALSNENNRLEQLLNRKDTDLARMEKQQLELTR